MKRGGKSGSNTLGGLWRLLRRCFFWVLSFGPMPKHIAFIMDGNRRYAKKRNMKEGGHNVGYATLITILQYCYEMGVKYVTIYAFSIDNFKRKPEEVRSLMDLMEEKIKVLLEEGSIVHKFGIKINFWGNLDLLSESVRLAAEKAMASTASNSGPVLSVCVAYTSTNEILRAIKRTCGRNKDRPPQECINYDVADLEESLDSAGCPDPEIVLRTSGETRLSNFLLWQTVFSHLQSPNFLWPELSLGKLIWSILEYQKVHSYLEARRRTDKKHK